MAMSMYSVFFALLIFFSGGGGKGLDLLDVISTENYWQAKNITPTAEQLQADAGQDKPPENVAQLLTQLQSSEFATREKAKRELERMGPAVVPQLRPAMASPDPEVAAVASGLIKQFTERAQERAIRRLMAIRTLGERKENSALPLLKTLIDSRELFVSDYALRAVAQIEGRALEPVSQAEAFRRDAALMPRDTAVLGQVISQGKETFSLAALIDEGVTAAKDAGMAPMLGGPDQVIDKAKMLANATRRTLMLLECTGNLRLDGLTLAISKNVGPDGGWAIIAIRGKYNPVAVHDAFRLTMPAPAPQPAAAPAATPRINLEDEAAVLFPADDLLVFTFGSNEKERDAASDLIASAVRAGKGGVGDNAQLMALANGVRKTGHAWAAALTPDILKKEKMLEGIDSFTLETARDNDTLKFTFEGQGADADKVTAAVDEWNRGIKQLLPAVQQEAQRNKTFAPVADLFASLKVTAEGKAAAFTGEMKASIRQAMMSQLGMAGISLLLMEDTAPRGMRQELPPPGE